MRLEEETWPGCDSIERSIRGSNSFREGAQLRAIGCGASDSFCHIWTRSRPGRPPDAHHVHVGEAAPCLCPPQSTRTDAIPTRVRAMENPHAERQNVLIQRIIKNAVRASLPSMQPFLISRFCRINARKPSSNSTVVSRRVSLLPAVFGLPHLVRSHLMRLIAPYSTGDNTGGCACQNRSRPRHQVS